MKCLVCDIELKPITHKGVEVDYCESCKGVWFDRMEMDKLSDGVKEFNIVEPRLENMKFMKDYPEEAKRCPKCASQMDKVTINYKPPVFDYCPNDCGYWFDNHDELKEYIQSNMTAVEKPNVQAMVEILQKVD